MRSYHQTCPISRALDVLGDRWNLLVVRELLIRPSRFTDLRASLPGIAPNILAERLRALEAGGVVEQAYLPPPAASTVYRLTGVGVAARPILEELALWGVRHTSTEPGEADQAHWLTLAFSAFLRGVDLSDLAPAAISFGTSTGGSTVHVSAGGTIVRPGLDEAASTTVLGEPATFYALLDGSLDLATAVETGAVRVTGDDRPARELLSRGFRAAVPAPRSIATGLLVT